MGILLEYVSHNILRYIIDEVIFKSRFSMLLPSILTYVSVVVGQVILAFFENYYAMASMADVTKNEQLILYDKVQKVSYSHSSNSQIGDLLARATSDIDEIANFFVLTKPVIILNICDVILILVVLFTFSWQLGLLILATIPLYYWILNYFNKRLLTTSKEERKGYSKVMESLREKMEEIGIIRLFAKEQFFHKKLENDTENWRKEKRKYSWAYTGLAQGIIFVITITTPLIIGLGGYMVMNNTLTIGTLMAFYSFSSWLYNPLRMINEQLAQLQRADTLSQRFFEILDLPEEESEGIYSFPKNYDIKYNKVSFTYKDELVLKDINLYIDKNEKIAIVGTSGSGKSTMMNLLVRLYDPTSGEILLEDKNLKEYNLSEIREHIKLVRGNDPLFNMSVKENIMLGDEFTDQEFNKAVKKAKKVLLFTKRLLKVSWWCEKKIFYHHFSSSNFLLLTLSMVIPTISPFSYLIITSSSVSSESSA
ncbi:MAG: ABC transporter ATP-binding protein [Defluviitoga tunisiensis]